MAIHNFEINEKLEDSPFDFAYKKEKKVLKEKSNTLKDNEKVLKTHSNSVKSYSLSQAEIDVVFFGLEKLLNIPIGMTDKADIQKIKNFKVIAQKLIQQNEIMLERGLVSMMAITGPFFIEPLP